MKRTFSPKLVGSSAVAAVGLAGVAMFPVACAATLAPSTAAAKAPAWHIVESIPQGPVSSFAVVVATGATTGYTFKLAYDEPPVVYQRTGASAWKRVSFPFPGTAGGDIADAQATSPSDVWVFGNLTTQTSAKSEAVELVKGKWTVVRTFAGFFDAASVVAANDVWVSESEYAGSGTPGLFHFDGTTWTRVSATLNGQPSALSGTDVWVAGGSANGTTITHDQSGTITSYNLAKYLPAKNSTNSPALTGAVALADNNVYAVGSGFSGQRSGAGPVVVLHFNGRTWSKVASYGNGAPYQVTPDGKGGLWILFGLGGGTALLHYTDGKLTSVPFPDSTGKNDTVIDQIWVKSISHVPGSTEELAVGNETTGSLSRMNFSGEVLQSS